MGAEAGLDSVEHPLDISDEGIDHEAPRNFVRADDDRVYK
jgi:hypothetical protein